MYLDERTARWHGRTCVCGEGSKSNARHVSDGRRDVTCDVRWMDRVEECSLSLVFYSQRRDVLDWGISWCVVDIVTQHWSSEG